MAGSRVSSRQAIWSRWTRSVVRVESTAAAAAAAGCASLLRRGPRPRAAAEVALSGARRAEQDEIGAPAQPGIAGGERHDLGLADPPGRLRSRRCRWSCRAATWLRRDGVRCGVSCARPSRCSAKRARKRAAGHPSLSAWAARSRPDQLDRGQPQPRRGAARGGRRRREIGRLHAAPRPDLVPSSS